MKERIKHECKWTKYLPRKLNGNDVKINQSSHHVIVPWLVNLCSNTTRMEDNERLWVNNLILNSEHSAQPKIHKLQTYFVTIGCIIERNMGNKPKVDVNKFFDNILLSNDFAHGSSEGNYATKRMETFLEISEETLKDQKNKVEKSRKEGRTINKENLKLKLRK
ncbi:hypothetical protein ACJMK2_005456 [Sinanodonta woodiana]|uniref:Uncharacterized protein n=1 Tax=Sinanodonta woodiana TaxID=1069815 RepID=A0ABD3VQ57_SINWO